MRYIFNLGKQKIKVNLYNNVPIKELPDKELNKIIKKHKTEFYNALKISQCRFHINISCDEVTRNQCSHCKYRPKKGK